MPRHMLNWLELTAIALMSVTAGTGCTEQSSGSSTPQFAAAPREVLSKPTAKAARVLTRLLIQDYESKSMKWADITDSEKPALNSIGDIDGFPKLDSERHQLVQMEAASGLALVGVRENEDERHTNGWVLIDLGVQQQDHGDHSHWKYPQPPSVRARQLDGKQGNPAHAYQFDGVFYLANDENSGYTRLDPSAITSGDDEATIRAKAGFHQGGGHHITLAVAEGRVGYAAWIDGGGPNKGRIDVTSIKPEGNTSIAYSFHLPTGAIHGATYCHGRVFFASADGVCWVDADVLLQADPKGIEVHHISLGKDEVADKPHRTGAFNTFGKYVLCVSGEGPNAALCLLDAKQESPSLTKILLDMQAGNRPTMPEVVETRAGKRYAFVFHDHPQDVDAENRLSIIDLDPNGDGEFTDANVTKSVAVGASRVEGHYGHHAIAFDADARRGYFTNPGDGTLVVLDLRTLEAVAEFRIGGIPTKVLAWGGRE